MRPVELAREACRQTGHRAPLDPDPRRHRRLAVDGARRADARISSPGCRTIHGPLEWVSVQDMSRATEMCIELAQLWGSEEHPAVSHAERLPVRRRRTRQRPASNMGRLSRCARANERRSVTWRESAHERCSRTQPHRRTRSGSGSFIEDAGRHRAGGQQGSPPGHDVPLPDRVGNRRSRVILELLDVGITEEILVPARTAEVETPSRAWQFCLAASTGLTQLSDRRRGSKTFVIVEADGSRSRACFDRRHPLHLHLVRRQLRWLQRRRRHLRRDDRRRRGRRSGVDGGVDPQARRRRAGRALTFIIILIGGLSSVATDAGYLILIPLGAAAFLSVGRHPLAGIAAAYAGVSAAFSVNILIAPLDALLTEMTNEAIADRTPGETISITANWYF